MWACKRLLGWKWSESWYTGSAKRLLNKGCVVSGNEQSSPTVILVPLHTCTGCYVLPVRGSTVELWEVFTFF